MKRLLNATAVVVASSLLLAACGGGSDDEAVTSPPVDDTAAMEATEATNAINMANNAAAALDDMSDADAVAAVEGLIDTAVAEIADLPAADQAAATARLQPARTEVMQHNARLANAATNENKAMMAEAKKLHTGIGSSPLAAGTAAYDGDNVEVTLAGGDAEALSEDKKTMVAALHGWSGKKYTASGTGVDGTYEAHVYSNVGDPVEGDPFDEEYGSDVFSNGTLNESTTEGTPERVASSSFDQSAGVKSFKLPTNNVAVMISGSYHGVDGTYSCTPAEESKCAAEVATGGFNLGGVDEGNAFTAAGGTWTFKPGDSKAKVMSVEDMHYASYGWWFHKSADGAYTASAFVDNKDGGTASNVPAAVGVTNLKGTATYSGGAAGKYALHSTTGGTNDAGHFTAAATLKADFGDDMISGTINNFIGADSKSRDWSVELMEQGIGDGGIILGDSGTGDAKMTKWTIGETAANAAGQWSGHLQENGDDGVPEVATGTFNALYGGDGNMVGAFGATK